MYGYCSCKKEVLAPEYANTHMQHTAVNFFFFFFMGQQWTIWLDMFSQVIRHGLHVLEEAWFVCMHAPEELRYLFLICKLYAHSLEIHDLTLTLNLTLSLMLTRSGGAIWARTH